MSRNNRLNLLLDEAHLHMNGWKNTNQDLFQMYEKNIDTIEDVMMEFNGTITKQKMEMDYPEYKDCQNSSKDLYIRKHETMGNGIWEGLFDTNDSILFRNETDATRFQSMFRDLCGLHPLDGSELDIQGILKGLLTYSDPKEKLFKMVQDGEVTFKEFYFLSLELN